MLTRTRNELLIAGAFALAVIATGVVTFRAHTVAADPVGVVTSDDVLGDHCPTLTSWVASPLQTSVGAWIDVAAAAVDVDLGEHLTFAWTPAASFAAPSAPSTRYHCTASGSHLLTVTAADDHRPTRCTTRVTLAVTCIAP
jgi:hypothetical protein